MIMCEGWKHLEGGKLGAFVGWRVGNIQKEGDWMIMCKGWQHL